MISQMTELRTEGKTQEEIIDMLVRQINNLSSNLQFALQNIDMSDVTNDSGYTLADLLAAGALKGDQGVQGPDGRVYKPTVSAEGVISWTLTDTGGTTPSPQNIKGPTGAAGVGVPAGGTTGQVLAKASDDDYDTEWVTP